MQLTEILWGFNNLEEKRANFRKVLLDLSKVASNPFQRGQLVPEGDKSSNISKTYYTSTIGKDVIELLPILKSGSTTYAARLRIYTPKALGNVSRHPAAKAVMNGERDVEWYDSSVTSRFAGPETKWRWHVYEYDVEI